MSVQIILTPEEFAEDLDLRLGRANGNIYHRKPGVEGVHDGQVMVRLKKKRFVILDYSIIPNEADIQVAQNESHITVPPGAGKTSCTNADCNKVGVPVMLYDSDPTEPPSLYMRSGLCFTCQRNLNEKRRTQRKRPSDASGVVAAAAAGGAMPVITDGSVFGSTSIPKKYKVSPGAIVIHPVDGLRPHGDGYGFSEIGSDLQGLIGDISNDTHRLLHAVGSSPEPPPAHHSHHHNDIAAATAAAMAASVGNDPGHLSPVDDAATSAAMDVADASSETTNGNENPTDDHHHHHDSMTAATDTLPTTSEDINALYDKAYESMNKGIYLLCQWKQSWDSAIAAAVAQESVDHSLADAVASAAAVAAAASESQNANVASLLLAAGGNEKRDDKIKVEDDAAVVAAAEAAADATDSVVEAFEV